MKSAQNLLILAAILVATTISSCKKTNNSPTATGKPFYCKIDGTEYIPAGGGRYYNLSGAIPGIQIVGDTTYETLEIYVSSANTGTYTLGTSGNGSNFASVYVNAGNKVYVSTTGEVKITKSANSKISGTFHYSATGTSGNTEVTDGEFNDIPLKN